MNTFRKVKFGFIVSGMLLFAGIFIYVFIMAENLSISEDRSPECEKCKKNKAKSFTGENIQDTGTANTINGSNFFVKIFSSLTSGTNDGSSDKMQGDDPVKAAAVHEINSLSKRVCNEENFPEDIWISPKLMERDPHSHIKELENLIRYCEGLKTGKTTTQEKKNYYNIKIRLLEERKELMKYYIETLGGHIEDMNEKKIAEIEERKAGVKLTPEEEKINEEIETENNRFYEEALVNTNKMIDRIDSAIKNYKSELARL